MQRDDANNSGFIRYPNSRRMFYYNFPALEETYRNAKPSRLELRLFRVVNRSKRLDFHLEYRIPSIVEIT